MNPLTDSTGISELDEPINIPRELDHVLCSEKFLASDPVQDPLEESAFLRMGDYWVIRYEGQAAILKTTRGLHYLAYLLHRPKQEFHVSQLLAHPLDVSTPAAAVALHGPVAGKLFAGFPVLDVRAKTEYKRRLKELRQDLEDAERFNDPQRKTEAHDEMQAIADHLAYGVGLGGRDRKASSHAERARSAITKCIKKAIQKIGEAIPSLGCHLATRIKTGYFCSYKPHPERPVSWKVLTASSSARFVTLKFTM